MLQVSPSNFIEELTTAAHKNYLIYQYEEIHVFLSASLEVNFIISLFVFFIKIKYLLSGEMSNIFQN